MFFNPLNLIVVAFVAVVAVAWSVVSARNVELKQNLLSYGVLALVSGVLLRSFASQWWAQLPLVAIAIGIWAWYLHTRLHVETTRAGVVALVGVLVGFFLRDTNLWAALILASIAVVVAFSGKLTIASKP